MTGVAVGLGVLSPAVISGQGAPTATQQSAPGWIFTPSIAVGGTWDDNVLLVNPGTEPPSDYGSPITPGVGLDYNGKFTRFSSGYSGALVRYQTLDSLNSFHQSLRVSAEHRVNARFAMFAQDSFASAPTTDVLQLAGVPFYRIGSRSNAAGGGIQAALAKHTALRSTYTLRSVGFDVNELSGNRLQGGHAHEFNGSVEQTLSPHLVVGGEYEFTRAIVNSRSPLQQGGQQDRFNMQSGSVTAQYQLRADTTLSGGLGVARLGAGLNHQGRTGPQFQAAIIQRAGRGVVSASFRRAYIPSFGFGGTFQNEQWTANVRMPLGRTRTYVNGGISWLNNDPLDSDQPSLQSAWLSAVFGYYATRWLSLEGFYGRTQQDSQRAGGQLERNQVGFRVVATKPVRLR
jgi:hypothetical protein